MAPKSRSQRTTRPPKRRATKKRAPAAAARKARGKRAANAAASSGVVEAALAAFAHEVRTPLTGILAISDLLATSDLDERERRWVDTIKAGAEHLASLATLFVDAAKSGESGLAVRQDFFDLRALARNAGDSLAGRAAAKGLRSAVEISEKIPAFVIGDPVRLRAALENLIDNAVKFTERGSVTLRAATAREPERHGRRRLRGLRQRHRADARRDQALVPAVLAGQCQHRVALRRRRARAVLGEATGARDGRRHRDCATARRRHHLHADRRAGARRRGRWRSRRVPTPMRSSGQARALRVLSVEDNPFGRVVLNTILTELGHHAEFIGQGEAAAERIARGEFDAVLMDMVLPGINGIEAIRRIRGLRPPLGRIAIIGVSGRADDETASRAAGADAFLVKPVSPRALATALLEATRRAAAAT